ncbi:MAG: hypothetical protein ACXVIY_01575 [Mucilaginibacter sp.]
MDDQFDKDLKKRIREVFDNYEDTTADKGWALIREKYPEKAKKYPVAWMWWSSAAAILLLFLGILWFTQSPEKQQQHFTNIKKGSNNKQPAKTSGTTNDQNADNTAVQQPDHILANATDNRNALAKPGTAPAYPATTPGKNQASLAANTRNNSSAYKTPTNSPIVEGQNDNSPTANSSVNTTTLASVGKPTDTNPGNPSNTAKTDTENISVSKSNATVAAPGISMQQPEKFNKQLLADNNQDSKQKGLSKNNLVRFGVYAASYLNYAKGSSSRFNVGAGFSADINLTRKLKVSTGIAIAQNSLSYPGQPVFSTPAGINMAPLALYSASTLQYSVSEPSFRNYSANLVGIDIPVNLKYTFDPGKSETYLLAGLSSGTFIDETYTYSFSNSQAQSRSARGGFYFAKMLNLAIGTGYRVGNNRLIIEPFLKYPLDGIGSQQIRFGSGGVNLKFSIPSQRR